MFNNVTVEYNDLKTKITAVGKQTITENFSVEVGQKHFLLIYT